MYLKKRELATDREDPSKIYTIENKRVSLILSGNKKMIVK
jgi:hypothetical protein